MGRKAKRTRTTPSKSAIATITIRPHTEKKNGRSYNSFMVQGWKENGKWQRKQFKKRKEAEAFAAVKRVEMENEGRKQALVLSSLTEAQHEDARQAFERLGSTYTLQNVVDFFLKHHRPPDFTIRIADARELYLEDRERDGVRERSRKAMCSVISQFVKASDNPLAHEVTPQMVEGFLRGLRAKDGLAKASRKTWNNYRNDLHGFFEWCATPDVPSNRPFLFDNPVTPVRKFSARQIREEQSAKPVTTSPEDVIKHFTTLMRWRKGVLLRYFALLYFAGIRPEELRRMSVRESELINLKTKTITIPADVSKTRQERQTSISDNLLAWLEFAPEPIIPKNFDRLVKRARAKFKLTHDEARHSFISYHVALHRSIGDAALQAGNSESIVRKHYLNLQPSEEGDQFFRIVPVPRKRRAETGKTGLSSKGGHLKAL